VQLRVVEKQIGKPEVVRTLLGSAMEELEQALGELRELARGLHPAVLADRGLAPALENLATRAPLPVIVEGVPEERLGSALEAALYFVVAESLTNAVKHAEASEVHVQMALTGTDVIVEIADNGHGGADPAQGSGLRGLADRVEALGGSLAVESRKGSGSVVRAQLPVPE
jgi:signal transduction histidine kinase